jgi:hypothetical protein
MAPLGEHMQSVKRPVLDMTRPDSQYAINQCNKCFNQGAGHFKRIKWHIMGNDLRPEMTHSIEIVRCSELGGGGFSLFICMAANRYPMHSLLQYRTHVYSNSMEQWAH